ncbi:hypothetical protein M758_1G301200 [Ceratodon purpureus]|uniref:Uncharacterized protein n=1 Tax=Ceratodon purpureus TaxID=3225 RepID=A0A8T0JDK5_CERPU|nr:hypothetical protein KC19_1G307700 [Ceratodon purpureus]KAG0632060.1 hypothetical protein M758_1G301200 [Ceratodon purpureus]
MPINSNSVNNNGLPTTICRKVITRVTGFLNEVILRTREPPRFICPAAAATRTLLATSMNSSVSSTISSCITPQNSSQELANLSEDIILLN